VAIAFCALALSAELASQAGTPGQQTPPRDIAQPALTGTGRIRGRVFAAGANTPLRRVQMTLTLPDNREFGRVITTDAQGRYEFSGLPAGRFTLRASKPGYVGLSHGQRRPYEAGTSIALAAGETITSMDFALPLGAVIAGRVTDEFGDVMPQVRVEVQRFEYGSDGQRRLRTAGTDTTDDRGEFRAYGLMPGEYVVNAIVQTRVVAGAAAPGLDTEQNAPVDGYPPTFYPGTPNANAAHPITIGIGQEASIQFGLTPARLSRISGVVRDSHGRPGSAEVSLLSRQGGSAADSRTAADGSFMLNGIVAGEYSLWVRQRLSTSVPAVAEFASVPVTVSGTDLTGLSITMSKGFQISGRVIWEGTASNSMPDSAASPAAPLRVGAAADTGAGWNAENDPEATGQVDANGTFRLGGVFGRVFLSLSPPSGWAVRSIVLDGQDITDKAIDVAGQNVDDVRITMTDKLANVSGRVSDARGSAVMQYVVVVQPTVDVEPTVVSRYVRTVRPDTNGRFEFRNLRPGRYTATAIESMEPNRQYSPEFRRELRRGAREFTVKEGESLSLDLRLVEGL
jgi:protocatechuate 3,4-dioxygenase beta subunit